MIIRSYLSLYKRHALGLFTGMVGEQNTNVLTCQTKVECRDMAAGGHASMQGLPLIQSEAR